MNPEIVLLVFGILFVATMIKSILGFGESLFAIPLLTLVMGIQVAAPLLSLIVAAITILMIIRNRRTIKIRAVWQLTLAAMVGVPVGIGVLKYLPERPITLGLGISLALLGLYYLLKPQVKPIHGRYWTFFFGFLSGVFGGAYNMAGAPIIIHGTTQQWQAEDYRGTLQSYFIMTSVIIVFNHALSGLLTPAVVRLAISSIPIMLLGFWIGTRLAEHIHYQLFEKILYVALIVLGLVLIIL